VAYHTTSGLLNLNKNRRTGLLLEAIDNEMRKQNIYYDDLIVGNILKKSSYGCGKNGFQDYMKSIGKLGGQNKIPRLSDNRKIVDLLNLK
jgi:hypothetical protein